MGSFPEQRLVSEPNLPLLSEFTFFVDGNIGPHSVRVTFKRRSLNIFRKTQAIIKATRLRKDLPFK